MNVLDVLDIDYVSTVTVERPAGEYDGSGNYAESFVTVIEDMPADIQLSLQVRTVTRDDGTGRDDSAVWIMFCSPPEPLEAGDRVCDGDRTYVVDAVGEWGTHTECIMSRTDD